MADSAPASPASPVSPDSRPRLTERSLARRQLLAIGAAAPVAVVIARASGAFTASGAPLSAGAPIAGPDTPYGTAHYFC
jgi:hypothetical protein